MDKDQLFTRRQICQRVGLSDDLIAYWIVQGLLVPAVQEGGRGKPRLFRRHQLNLAGLLKELHGFGANVESLRKLAGKFNAAFTTVDNFAIDPEHEEVVADYVLERQFVKDGMLAYRANENGRPWSEHSRRYLDGWSNNKGEYKPGIPQDLFDRLEATEMPSLSDHFRLFWWFGSIPQENEGAQREDPFFFCLDENGSWVVDWSPPAGAKSAIAIYPTALLCAIWWPSDASEK